MRTSVRVASRTQGAGKPRCSWKKTNTKELCTEAGEARTPQEGAGGGGTGELRPDSCLCSPKHTCMGTGRAGTLVCPDLGRVEWLPGYLTISFGFLE